MHRTIIRAALVAALSTAVLAAAAPLTAAPPSDRYTVTPLASNIPGLAPTTDPNLVNGWGLARSAGSPWWVADNGTDKTTIYNGAGVLQMIGGAAFQTVEGEPTGAVFSGIAGQFQVGTTASPTTLGTSNFVFAGEDGTIRAWRGGSTAALVTVPAARCDLQGPRDHSADGDAAAPVRGRLSQRARRRLQRRVAPRDAARSIRRP